MLIPALSVPGTAGTLRQDIARGAPKNKRPAIPCGGRGALLAAGALLGSAGKPTGNLVGEVRRQP